MLPRVLAVLVLLMSAIVLSAPPAGADHWEKYIGPEEPRRDFPRAFVPLLPKDRQARSMANPWDDPRVGGWGSDRCPTDHEARTPVVFVHGNGGHAGHWTIEGSEPTWVNVRDRFLASGYCRRELWAISYDGAGSYSTYDDVNASEVYRFIQKVRAYLGVAKVDVVAHSLGVTVVRKAGFLHGDLYRHIRRFVAIAGANHGTTTCRGSQGTGALHVCDEIGPGSPWLQELNGIGETPAGPAYLTLYDGSGLADEFFLGPDARSPRLKGACNHEMLGVDHLSLAWGRSAVGIYLSFVRDGEFPTCHP